MIRREHLEEDRKRAEAYEALAHPVGEPQINESISPIYVTRDGAEIDDAPPEEDILEGLDRLGLDPREPEGGGR